MNNRFDVAGKIALVTGATRGLGYIQAHGLAAAGARVVVNGRDPKTVEDARRRLADEGFDAHGVAFDIASAEAVAKGIRAIEEDVGPIEILVNNAGIQHRAPLEEFPEDAWRRILDVNLTGAFLVSREVVRGMKARGRGKIVNICSLQSDLGRATIAPYAASKGGLKMLTRGMTVDWAKYGIQINGIGPGYLVTEMTQPLKDDPEFDRWICGRTRAGRWGDPDELIGALLFFASPASDFVNGQLLY
ncbi:MAG: SDR family NAD(P)-dependent oxidoreductase, partial [Spirochaetota bacterium]